MKLWLQCGTCWRSTLYEGEELLVRENLGVHCSVCGEHQPCIALFIQRDRFDKTIGNQLTVHELLAFEQNEYLKRTGGVVGSDFPTVTGETK